MEAEHTTNHIETDSVLVAGGGLAGSLMALYLAQRGYGVDVYEYRHDMRKGGAAGGRSINLALSERGLNALRAVGLEDRIRELCIPMHGRMIHDIDGGTHLQPYGKEGQFINSVSRQLLNEILMDAAEDHERVDFHFRKRCMGFTRATGSVRFKDLDTDELTNVLPKVTIGADGAFSALRYRMQTTGSFQYQQDFASHGYKELTIPPKDDGTWRLEKNALHIWPRQDFMMIALPNLDGSFTCTLFMAYEGGPESFAALKTPEDVQRFYETWFPDAIPHLTKLTEEFFDNPTGSLVTIRCTPYNYEDKVLLIGDAAHAIVPFYGQGMNAAFEDCFELDRLVDKHGGDWATILRAFSEERKPNADAIADLALYNYIEMRDLVQDRWFLFKKKLHGKLHELFPTTWIPLYTMVTFTTIPYADAKARAARQDELLVRGLVALGVFVAVALLVALAVLRG